MPSTAGDVVAPLAYLVPQTGRAQRLIYPPGSGRPSQLPAQEHHRLTIVDCRTLAMAPSVDRAGFALLTAPFRHR